MHWNPDIMAHCTLMTSKKQPFIIIGNSVLDDRGVVRFVNDFSFTGVKRFYHIENHSPDIIRAFHGHKKEAKYLYVALGSALICTVCMDNFKNPSPSLSIDRWIVSSQKPQVLYIPPGYANGIKHLTPDTQVIIYSTASLSDSLKDDYRYPYDYWGTDCWEINNR